MRTVLIIIAVAFVSGCGSDIERKVRIVRDDYGVPHIYADTIHGLYYGYGYSIAQDRLFQMEMARRSTQGTVAEVLGADYVDYDINARMLFSPASIRSQLDELEQKDLDVFEGYAAGINAWLAEIPNAPAELMPIQFIDFGFEPTDWTAFDIAMIFIGTMNNRYGDFNTELENIAIYQALLREHGEARAQELFNFLNPRFTDNAPTTIPADDWSRPAYDSLAEVPAVNWPKSNLNIATVSTVTTGFSNCYVIGKNKLEDGGAILVNGPQFGWFTPAYVYSIGLHGTGIDVVGNSPFGYPMIMFGHNKTITWGSTWGASDIVDLFAEKLNPDAKNQYSYEGEYRELEHRLEKIAVKGGDNVDVDLYRSIHGPIVRFDEEAGLAYAKKRAWDGRELENMLSWLYASWASDFDEWKAEAEKSSINVNMYFADVNGNIAYYHGGNFPRRVAGHDNRFPATGDGSMDWQGRQDANMANPHVLNPSSGFLANWNNKPGQGVMNPDFFFYSWSSADRVDFLNNALASDDAITPDEAWALLDSSSYADVFAPYFLTAIDRAVSEIDDDRQKEANKLLQGWNLQSRDDDGDGQYDERATAIFRAFIGKLNEIVLQDDLGEAYPFYASSGYGSYEAPTNAGTNLSPGVKAIAEAIKAYSDNDTLNDVLYDPFNGVSINKLIRAALIEALDEVDDSGLRSVPRPYSSKNFLGIPQALESEARVAPIEQNRGTENNMIVMKPGAIIGWEVTPPGQSGFIGPGGEKSEHYDDQFEMYQKFGKKRMWFYADDVKANARSEIVLTY